MKKRSIIFISILLLCLLFLASLAFGRFNVPLGEVVRILVDRITPLEQTWADTMETAVINIRLPRILLAIMVGCSLSAAGAAYQGVFQNPMASPDLLGASSGACFGAALAIVLDVPRGMVAVFAFVCSFLTIMLVSAVGKHIRGSRIVNLILAGMMVSSLFSAATSYLKLAADPYEELPAITYWLMGGLSGTAMKDVGFALIPMLIGWLVLLLLRWRVNVLTVGEEEAMTMGLNTRRIRAFVILASTLLTAASVSVSGMIGWVGLVIPHLCRKLVGNDYRYLMPLSMVCGGIFLLMVDNLARNLIATEFPVGILTAFVGAPFFLFLMTRKGGNT